MSALPGISIRVHGAMPPAQGVELAQAADAAGFKSVWFAENAFARGVLPLAAACALATRRLQIGAGVFNPFGRHPTMMAMEIGALDELSNGRATLSIGTGIRSAVEKIGFQADKPLLALRDTITIVRGLLRGEEVDHAGPAFSARKVRLDYKPRADIAIFLAGRGDLTVKLSGEAADGLIISNMCSAAFAARAAELMQANRRAAGRSGHGQVIRFMPCAVRNDRAQSMQAAKRAVGEMLPAFWALSKKVSSAREGLLAGTDIPEAEFATAAARLQAGEDAADVLDERYAAAFALAGTPQDCLRAAQGYRAAGVTELALTFGGSTPLEDICAIGGALAEWQRAASGDAATR
jgi:5,10-methylenetetrahydromethanopterin reductase